MNRRKFIQKSIGSAAVISTKVYSSPLLGRNSTSQEFTLPKLNYDYAALEPHIDKQTMEIHYTKHHQKYIEGLNKEIASESALSGLSIEDILKSVSKYKPALRNNAGGHYNHTLFWNLLTPKKTQPSSELLTVINSNFGSLDKFKELFNASASTRFGSGWAWLIKDNNILKVCSTPNQDNTLMDIAEEKGYPLIGLDVWEHAYYLKYQNKRADYIAAFWNVLNWETVNNRYAGSK